MLTSREIVPVANKLAWFTKAFKRLFTRRSSLDAILFKLPQVSHDLNTHRVDMY